MPTARLTIVARTGLARRQLAFLILLYLLALWLAATAMRGVEASARNTGRVQGIRTGLISPRTGTSAR